MATPTVEVYECTGCYHRFKETLGDSCDVCGDTLRKLPVTTVP